MGKYKDITGNIYGRLTALYRATENGKPLAKWVCKCSCGKEVIVDTRYLNAGNTKSCGCYAIDKNKIRSTIHGCSGDASVATGFGLWMGMIQRCTNPNNTGYHKYGGRGISVCDKWRHSFENFITDMGPRPSLLHSIDRFPNNDGNYEPGNCRWATAKEQARNRRNSHLIEYNGQKKTISEWTEIYGLPTGVLWKRLKRGWNAHEALNLRSENKRLKDRYIPTPIKHAFGFIV